MSSATRKPHPHFNDQGALDWETSWQSAVAQAVEQGKLVFVEFGREL